MTQGPFKIRNKVNIKNAASDAYSSTIENASLGGNKTFTLPAVTAASVTVAQITEAQTFAGAQTCSTSIASPSHIITNGVQKTTLTRSATAADYTLATQDRSGYVADLQNTQDAAADKPSYKFDNSISSIILSTLPDLGYSDSTIIVTASSAVTVAPAATVRLAGVGVSAGTGTEFTAMLEPSTSNIKIWNSSTAVQSGFTLPSVANTPFTLAFKRHSTDKVSAYMNGVLGANALTLAFDNLTSRNFRLGYVTAASTWNGQIHRSLLFNYALSQDKIARYSAGAKLDWDDVGGSMNSPILLNGSFTTDTTSWTPVNGTIASVAGGQSGNCVEITRVSAAYQYIRQTITVVVGKTYLLTGYVKSGTSGNEIYNFEVTNGSQDIVKTGTSSASWIKMPEIVFTATDATAGVYLTKTTGTAGTMLFDTIQLDQLGCVLGLEPEGIYSNKWLDSSTNLLHGTVTGAVPTNAVNKYGTWVPVDSSGAGLTLTVNHAVYTKVGKMVFAQAFITFPSTADATAAKIGGLPFTSIDTGADSSSINISYTGYATALTGLIQKAVKTFVLYTYGGTAVTNANMSTLQLRFTAIYQTEE